MINDGRMISSFTEQNGLTRLTFSLPGDIVISKSVIPLINSKPFILPVDVIEKIAGSDVNYSVGSLISLSKYLRQGKINLGMTIKLLRDICDIITKTEENALYADNLSYSPDHIFINTQSTELKMILFPFETRQQTVTALRTLLSVLTSEIIQPDEDAAAGIKKIAEYCSRSDFRLSTFSDLLEKLDKNDKLIKIKKAEYQKSGSSFWRKLFRKKEKDTEPQEDMIVLDTVISNTADPPVIPRKRNGTELLLPDDELDAITAPLSLDAVSNTDNRIVRLDISINGMHSEAEINSFPCTLGRSPDDVNIILQDSGVSRKHAVIDFENGEFVIFDLGSSNGLILNDAKLAPKSKHLITIGDCIKIGRVELQVTKLGGV